MTDKISLTEEELEKVNGGLQIDEDSYSFSKGDCFLNHINGDRYKVKKTCYNLGPWDHVSVIWIKSTGERKENCYGEAYYIADCEYLGKNAFE